MQTIEGSPSLTDARALEIANVRLGFESRVGAGPSMRVAESAMSSSEQVFLQDAAVALAMLERAATAQYHGVLARILSVARREAERFMTEKLSARSTGGPFRTTDSEERQGVPELGRLDERMFLRRTLGEVKRLEAVANTTYHGILAHMLSAARQETEMLLREEVQERLWPRSTDGGL